MTQRELGWAFKDTWDIWTSSVGANGPVSVIHSSSFLLNPWLTLAVTETMSQVEDSTISLLSSEVGSLPIQWDWESHSA